MKPSKHILPVIVFAQFCGTSLWFSGNAVMGSLVTSFDLTEASVAHLTSAVQFGFIAGTLVFALLSIADRFPPSKVFVVSAALGALFNLCVIWEEHTIGSLLLFRFLTGFFLAGIYPVGMKIAADYYDKGLGKSLGYLVGALVLGTAFPHLLQSFMTAFPWKHVIVATSIIATVGGLLLVLVVPNGPYRKKGTALQMRDIAVIFKNQNFKQAAIGYFGHMWELYAFWSLIPLILGTYSALWPGSDIPVSLYSFYIIGVGAISCIVGGHLSKRFGVKQSARTFLMLSALCCLVSPLVFYVSSTGIMLAFLCFWGAVVIADSPLFSTMVAHNAPASIKGTAITMVTCIGFAITIISIQLLVFLQDIISLAYTLPFLGIGPVVGLWFIRQKNTNTLN